MKHIRLSIVGFGTVGRWLADAVYRRGTWLERECGVKVSVVSVATRRGGFIHCDAGFDIPNLLNYLVAGKALADYPGVQWWGNALEGLAATEYDVLAETSNTNPRDPEPALSHIRVALERGTHVITSSKGACAAAALELTALAKKRGVHFRMESTVMSGTPVLSTLQEGLAGTRVIGFRGILNGTANHILSKMAEGLDYSSALADAKYYGYAEPDPTDDVEGYDIVAKVRILTAVAFGQAVSADQVILRGITEITQNEVQQAAQNKCRIKLLASVQLGQKSNSPEARHIPLECRVEPVALPLTDPLSRIDGVMNALTVKSDTVSEITIIGPGAGPEQAGQGIFTDLATVARSLGAF